MALYIIDDVLVLPDDDVLVSMRRDDWLYDLVVPSDYLRVPRDVLNNYELFRTILWREFGIPFDYPQPDGWHSYVEGNIESAGTSVSAWGNRFTE